MKLLKKLAILTCALAAFSFVACDSGNNDDDEPNTPVVDEGGSGSGEEEGEEAGEATVTVAISGESKKFVEGKTVSAVYAYLYNESDPANTDKPWGDWPGKVLEFNKDLNMWVLEAPVDTSAVNSWTVMFNDNIEDTEGSNTLANFAAGVIEANGIKLYNRIGDWVEWDGTSADKSVVAGLTEESTVLAIDISKVPVQADKEENGKVEKGYNTSKWTEVAVYSWVNGGSELFGGFPGKQLTRSEVNKNIFYLVVDGNEGSGNLIFNNNQNGEQFDSAYATLEKGKKYLVTAAGVEGFAEWTDFSLDKLVK